MLVQLSARMPYLPKSGLDLTEPCRRFGQSSHVAELLHGAQKKCAEFGSQPVTALGRGGVKVEKRQHIVTSSRRIELHVLIDLRSVERRNTPSARH